MNKIFFKSAALVLLVAGMQLSACNSKPKTTTTTTTSPASVDTGTTSAVTPAPVEIAPDDSLTTGAKDAVKDFSGVKAEVNNGEITLTGDITRERLPKLMMAISSLHPKKINNNLTIK